MTVLQAALLGLLQGLTEFFPVSSSGHLVVAERLLGVSIPVDELLGFDVLLHGGSLMALFACFFPRWRSLAAGVMRRDRQALALLVLLVIATVPGALAGMLLGDVIEQHTRSLSAVGLFFLITAAVLVLGERFPQRRAIGETRLRDAVLIGCAQALALLPGLSRSGLTISAGRALGMRRGDALEFSFLMAVPIIAGATLATLTDIPDGGIVLPSMQATLAGVAASLVASIAAIVVLRRIASRVSFAVFAWYLVFLGGLILLGTSGRMGALGAALL